MVKSILPLFRKPLAEGLITVVLVLGAELRLQLHLAEHLLHLESPQLLHLLRDVVLPLLPHLCCYDPVMEQTDSLDYLCCYEPVMEQTDLLDYLCRYDPVME